MCARDAAEHVQPWKARKNEVEDHERPLATQGREQPFVASLAAYDLVS